jgi:uncharacterized protein (TIGR03118 family)
MLKLCLMLCFSLSGWAEHFSRYEVINLVANEAGYGARTIDPRLINPWGLTFSARGNLIVADNDSSVLATAYRPEGAILPFVIPDGYNPTGLETNHNPRDFIFGSGHNAARLLFATEQGVILAYNRDESPNAIVVADRSNVDAHYTGLALGVASHNRHQQIFAADFRNNRIDIFDNNFNFVKSFGVPPEPGYSPFNIRNFDGCLYIAWAKQDPEEPDEEVLGPGLGFVDIYDTNGRFVERLISHGALNAPWGLAIAPRNFGHFSGALLVGNFGDGTIHAYEPDTGDFLGTLLNANGTPITIEGLWSLKFDFDEEEECAELYFTAGPEDETDGLLGVISPQFGSHVEQDPTEIRL